MERQRNPRTRDAALRMARARPTRCRLSAGIEGRAGTNSGTMQPRRLLLVLAWAPRLLGRLAAFPLEPVRCRTSIQPPGLRHGEPYRAGAMGQRGIRVRVRAKRRQGLCSEARFPEPA